MGGQVHADARMTVRWIPVLLALALVTIVPTPASAASCQEVDIDDGTEITPRHNEYGDIRLCDTDHDDIPDKVVLQTRKAPTETTLNLVNERRWDSGGPNQHVGGELLVDTGLPYGPYVYTGAFVEDDGDDEEIDRAYYTFETKSVGFNRVFLVLFDGDDDGVADEYGFQVCSTKMGGCAAPGPGSLPGVDVPGVQPPFIKVPFTDISVGG